jgi:hypothetical protein
MIHLKPSRHFLAITVLFLVILIVFFYDVTFGGKTFKATTMFAQAMPYGPYGQGGNYGASCHTFLRESASIEEPFYQFMKMNLVKGIFPLWNPHQYCGAPNSLMMDAGVFFPLTALVYLLPNTVSLDALILMRMLVAGLLMYWFMYVLGFSFLARIASALTFVLTGPMVTHHLWFVNVDLLLPLLFLSVYKVFLRPSQSSSLLFSLAIALSVFAGHIEHIFLTHCFLVFFILFLFWQKKEESKDDKKKIAKNLVIFYALGISMAAVVLLPFLVDFIYSWTSHTAMYGMRARPFLVWASQLITVIVPAFFRQALVSLSGDSYNWGGGYLGVIVVLLCFLGLGCKKQRQIVLFFAVSIFIFFGIATDSVYTSWLGYLPILNLLSFGMHSLFIFAFIFSFLAGAGMEEIIADPEKSLKRAIGIAAGIIIFVAIYLWVYRSADFFPQAFRASGLTIGILAIAMIGFIFWMVIARKNFKVIASGLLFLLILELFIHNPRCRPNRLDSFPQVPYVEFLRQKTSNFSFRAQGLFLAFYKNTAMAYGVDSFTGSQALVPARYIKFVQRLISSHSFPKALSAEHPPAEQFDQDVLSHSDILALANVNYFVLPEESKISSMAAYSGEVEILPLSSLFPLPSAAPRAYLAYDWTIKEKGQDEEVLRLIKERGLGVVPEVVVESDPGEVMPIPQDPALKVVIPAQEIKRWANGVILKASADQQALLVLSDSYFPGWKAWVDGRPAKIYPANYLFRGVFLSSGEHTVEFRFVPFWFYFGLAVTCLSFIIFFCFLMSSRLKSSRKFWKQQV